MTLPYVVLSYYKPTKWKAYRVGRDITEITKTAGLVPHKDPEHGTLTTVPWFNQDLHAEVRKKTFNTKQAEDFHQDGDTTPGARMNCGMVLWATNTPTEIEYKGKIYRPEPYEVVLFLNQACRHRRPAGCPRERWVFRQRVAVPTHIKLPD